MTSRQFRNLRPDVTMKLLQTPVSVLLVIKRLFRVSVELPESGVGFSGDALLQTAIDLALGRFGCSSSTHVCSAFRVRT